MEQVFLFNTGATNISFSINDGPFLKINSTSISIDWEPLLCPEKIIFTNQTEYSSGQLGWGKNTLIFYPEGFAHKPATFSLEFPKNVMINSLQLYFLCGQAANSYAIAVCINGKIYRLFYPEIK